LELLIRDKAPPLSIKHLVVKSRQAQYPSDRSIRTGSANTNRLAVVAISNGWISYATGGRRGSLMISWSCCW